MLGVKDLLALSPWPEYDESKTVDATIEIAVQICGKLKATVFIPAESDKDQMIALAKQDEKIASLLEGKQIIKEIAVPGKLVNIVAR